MFWETLFLGWKLCSKCFSNWRWHGSQAQKCTLQQCLRLLTRKLALESDSLPFPHPQCHWNVNLLFYPPPIAPLRVTFPAKKTSKQSLGIQPVSLGDPRERSENLKIHFQFSLMSLTNGSKRPPKGFKRSTWQSSKVIHPQFSLKLQCKRNGTYTFVHMSFHAINSRVAEREARRSERNENLQRCDVS